MNTDSDSNNRSPINLGFLEPVDQSDEWELESKYFPSKLGGKPAWLNLKDPPAITEIICPNCKIPRAFLCQIYANIDSLPSCFHRTLFVFMCRSVKVRDI